MAAQDIIVIGGSAGSLAPLTTILEGLRRPLPATLLVAIHTSPEGESALPAVLDRHAPLPVAFPSDGDPIRKGQIYVAPPDHHLLTRGESVAVIQGPRENGFRPAIDPLFRSAANDFGGRVVGVLLSGALDDGTFGLKSIKAAGGTAIVQHPYEAMVPSMPLSAIEHVEVDHIVRTAEIAGLLTKAVYKGLVPKRLAPAASKAPVADELLEQDVHLQPLPLDSIQQSPSRYTCPQCGGALWEIDEGGQFRFRCHTGHGFTADAFLAEQYGQLEHALWTAFRVLKERAALHRLLAEKTSKRGIASTAERFLHKADDAETKAQAIFQVLNAPGELRMSEPERRPCAPPLSKASFQGGK